MTRITKCRVLPSLGLAVLNAGLSVALTGVLNAPAAAATTPDPIQHVVVIVQENRTFDNLFNGYPGANSRNYGYDSKGNKVYLQPEPLGLPYDLDHSHTGFETEWAKGKMNGFDLEGHSPTTVADPAYTYVPEAQVKPYWDIAAEFALADNMFQSNEGPSFPAHQFLIAGQSGHFSQSNPNPLDGRNLGPLGMSENIAAPKGAAQQGGCDAAALGYKVQTINQDLLENRQPSSEKNDPKVLPCVNYATILDELEAKKLTWSYYTPSYGVLWDAPDAISHIRYVPARWKNVKVPETSILDDIALGKLANVSYVIPRGLNSDHPGNANATGGPDWVATVLNAIGTSPYWKNTIVVVTWDDWGGFYDHVPPTILSSYSTGLRVPALLISPYAKQGYVSHTRRDFGSILRVIENHFGVASLGQDDSYNEAFGDCQDFTKPPRAFVPIQTLSGATPAMYRHLRPDASPVDDD